MAASATVITFTFWEEINDLKMRPNAFRRNDDRKERKALVHQSSYVTIEEIIGVQVINEERPYYLHVAVFDAMVQTEKEENSSGDA
ncbi:hypothetical protein Bca101_058366 [Brassica carinata]